MNAVDYSVPGPIDLELVRAAGYVGVVRYLTGPNALTRAEVDELHAHGQAVGLIFETTASRAFSGFMGGVQDATIAENRADTLGAPDTTAIYYAVDTDARRDLPAVVSYFIGINSVARRPIGCYGGDAAWSRLDDVVDFRWQAAATSWSDEYPSPAAHLVQLLGMTHELGGNHDENTIQNPAWGQWPAPTQEAPPMFLIRRAQGDPDRPDQPAGHTELLDGFGGEWWEPSYNELPNVPAVSNTVWDEVHASARARGAALAAIGAPAPPTNVVVTAADELAEAIVDELADRLDDDEPKVWTSDKTGVRAADAPDPAAVVLEEVN